MDNNESKNNDLLDLSEDDIDNLLLGCDINKNKIDNNAICINCKSYELINDNGHLVCQDCGVINDMVLDKNPSFNKDEESSNSSYGCPTNYFFPQSA